MKDFPKGRYAVIYADPPWEYRNKQDPTIEAHRQYPTMSPEDLAALPVQSISERDCLLFMWVTCPTLGEAITLGEAWGFEYKTIAFVWDKGRCLPGFYTLSQTELCLVFKRKGGKIPEPRGARNIKQMVIERRTCHSSKPNEVRRRIESMFPAHNKIELFARIRVPGWDAWGNECDESPGSLCRSGRIDSGVQASLRL